MDQASSAKTGIVTGTLAGIVPVVDWVLNTRWQANAPQAVVVALSAALLTVGHLICNRVNAKYGKQLTAIEISQGVTNETVTPV